MGYNHQVVLDARVADDFTVAEEWTLKEIDLWAYQVGAGPSHSTITSVNLRIWDGSPVEPGSRVILGDSSTNLLVRSVWDSLYRTDETDVPTATSRAVYRNTCVVPDWVLAPGVYWLDWQADGVLSSGPFVPPVTIPGLTHPESANALQYSEGVWSPLEDGGSHTPDELKFVIRGLNGDPTSIESPGDITGRETRILFAPHPFPRDATVRLHLESDGRVRLLLFDVAGRLALVPFEGPAVAGVYALPLPPTEAGRRIAPGVYFYRLDLDGRVRDRGRVVITR